jgi:ADP-ribose pyrophosphatase YjhB (NUDIX family)
MPKPKDLEKQRFMFTEDIKFLQKAVMFHPEDKDLFLALKRSLDSFSRPGDWDLPGGNVLYGELHKDSLKREIKEETILEVENIKPVQVITNYNKEKKIYYIFVGHYGQATSDNVKISNEHSEFRWVTKNEFIKLKPAKYLVDLVKEVFEYNKNN